MIQLPLQFQDNLFFVVRLTLTLTTPLGPHSSRCGDKLRTMPYRGGGLNLSADFVGVWCLIFSADLIGVWYVVFSQPTL